jgi:hypothetical protein
MFSVCVVTKWRDWSECIGSCSYALQVRNRDVLRPPFPEIDQQTGEVQLPKCPTLYETKECQPKECLISNESTTEESTTTLPTTTTRRSSLAPAVNEFFRDLPSGRSAINDNSPFEFTDKVLNQKNLRKVADRPTTRLPKFAQKRIAHRPDCKNQTICYKLPV